MSTNKTQVEANGGQLIITRQFDAPRKKVFQAHTDCRHLKHWWGPREWPLTYCNMDFRVGGKWHYCMSGPDGAESWGLTIYKEIVESELLVYEDHFSDKDGNQNKEMPSTTVRTEFLEKDGKTILRSTAIYASPDDVKKLMEMGMAAGITETQDKLEEYLAVMQ